MCAPQTIIWISNDCVGFSNVAGSSTSTSIWSRLNHDMEVKGGPLPTARNQLAVVCCPNSGGASRRWCCLGSGERGTISPRRVHLPAALVPRQRVAGSGQRSGTSATWHWCLAAVVPRGGGASRRWCLVSGALAGNDRGQQSLFPPCRGSCASGSQSWSSFSPNSSSTMAEITPTTSLVGELPETSENLTCYAP